MGLSLCAAIAAQAADFGSGDADLDVAVARNLLHQIFVKLAFEFADFPAADAGDVNVVARAVAFVIVPVAAKVQQVELVNQPMSLQQVDRAVDRHRRDVRIDLVRTPEDFGRVEMAPRRLHHLQDHAALARQPNPPRAQFAL